MKISIKKLEKALSQALGVAVTINVNKVPLRGEHHFVCIKCAPSCPCVTCRNDHDSTNGHENTCCVDHGRNCDSTFPCPDYLPEDTP